MHSSVVTESGHPDYLDHLGHFLFGSKWISSGHINMPDPDQKYLVIVSKKNCNKISNRAVTNISRMRS